MAVVAACRYISCLTLSLSTMLHLDLPHVNVLSKVDLLRLYGQLGAPLGRAHAPRTCPPPLLNTVDATSGTGRLVCVGGGARDGAAGRGSGTGRWDGAAGWDSGTGQLNASGGTRQRESAAGPQSRDRGTYLVCEPCGCWPSLARVLRAAAAFNLDFYTEVQDLQYLVRSMGNSPFTTKFRSARRLAEALSHCQPSCVRSLGAGASQRCRCVLGARRRTLRRKLSSAICDVVQDYGLVSFVPLAIQVRRPTQAPHTRGARTHAHTLHTLAGVMRAVDVVHIDVERCGVAEACSLTVWRDGAGQGGGGARAGPVRQGQRLRVRVAGHRHALPARVCLRRHLPGAGPHLLLSRCRLPSAPHRRGSRRRTLRYRTTCGPVQGKETDVWSTFQERYIDAEQGGSEAAGGGAMIVERPAVAEQPAAPAPVAEGGRQQEQRVHRRVPADELPAG